MSTKPTAPARRGPPAGAPAFARPFTLVDIAIFTMRDDRLEVLLVQRPEEPGEPFPGQWALPGGFVDIALDADLQGCARRKLLEKTGVASPYLEQLGSWGSATRDPRGWSATHVYFALLPARELPCAERARAAGMGWFEPDRVLQRPRLAFDHATLLAAALERLRGKVEYTSLPAFLLAEPFTLPQLQHAYEVVLGRPVDKSGFRTRMLAADFLQETGRIESAAHRPPMGYRLKDRSAPVFFPRTFSPRGSD